MNPRYALTALRAGHRCEYCKAPEAVFNFPFEVEHVVPVVRGGPDVESNWALSCRSRNLRKGAYTRALDPETGRSFALFHPRQDRWARHFRFDPDTGTILGLTRRGRATVQRLQVNSGAQLQARRQWVRLGLFP